MHSSRMRTVRCSDRQGVSAGGGLSAQGGCLPGVGGGGVSHHALDRILDTRL